MRTNCLIAAALLAVSSWAAAESRFFRSNSIGMALDELTEYRSDEFLYVLEVSSEDTREMRTLWKDGAEYKRWETTSKGQLTMTRLYSNGVLVSETQERDGRLHREVLYGPDGLSSTSVYQYEGDELLSIVTRNAAGEIISTNTYQRTSDGKLRSVTTDRDETTSTSSFVYGGGNLIEEWHGEGGEGSLLRYSGNDVLSDEEWSEEGIREVTRYEYGETVVSRFVDFENDIEEYIQRDIEERPLFVRRITAGKLSEERTYTYSDGKLASVVVRTPLNEEKIVFVYAGEDLVSEEYTLNGTTQLVRTYTDTNSYTEDVYQDGIPFMRFTYEDGIRVSQKGLIDR